ncbi:8077_t:CDS:2, partial [Cetraspora pellucida]
SKIISLNIQDPKAKYNFERHYKKFELDSEALYIPAIYKDGEIKHKSYYNTYSTLSEKHIGIVQVEVQEYINRSSTCAANIFIKERIDIKPVISKTL